jgi:peptidoglycan hydrolase-like amidase
VTGPGGETAAVAGPVLFSPSSPENLFRVESIERTNILASGRVRPLYRGALEVARGASTQAGRVNLLNVLELEDYIRGVVVNESPAFFHAEALKAQATAARGYAVANVGRWFTLGYPFDLVDSASSQVYRGVSAEHPNAVLATEGTRGLVASYQGQIITAFYSSSFGGHSDSVEWIFNSPSSQLPGTNVTPYLRAIYDGEPPEPDLDDPAVFQSFWSTAQPPTYDACSRVNNRFARWRITVPAETIKARLTAGRHVVVSGDASGTVTGVDMLLRMAGSGRIGVARIALTSGVVDVRGWDNLRRVLGAPAASTPTLCPGSPIAAGFVLNNPSLLEPYTNADGTFGGVIAWGGGWGHNVGLSQYGARGRGRAGIGFVDILKAYYTGVDVGSYPIDIGRRPGSGTPTLRQEF